mgnify:CR=1 FL=1
MATLDVTGLSENRIRFLHELIALWRTHDPAEHAPEFKKISHKDLPPLPDWWRDALERVKDSPLAQMTEEEIGQLCEDLAERSAQRRMAQQAQ